MNPRELVETALRVLAAWTDGRKPAPADLNTLKEAFPSPVHTRIFDSVAEHSVRVSLLCRPEDALWAFSTMLPKPF